MLHVLTNDEVVQVEFAPVNWTVESLLQMIASAEPRYNALIDTQAIGIKLTISCIINCYIVKMHANGCV